MTNRAEWGLKMRGATYNQLMIFQAIVQEGNIRNAARKLEIAPPTASQALKALEENLGLPLFLRTTRSMELTEAGQMLYDNTTLAVSALNLALESVHDLRSEPTGKVRLTLPRFAYQWLLQPVYAEFCQRYPQLQLEVFVSDATVNLISKGLDAGIRFGDKVEEGMIARPLTTPMKDAIFAAPAYLDRYGLPEKPEDLAKHKRIQYRFIAANKLAPLILERDGQPFEVAMPTAMIVNDTEMLVDAACKGLGIGHMATPIVADAFEKGELIPILEGYWATYPGLYLYFPKNSQKAGRVRVLIDFLMERCKGRDSFGEVV